MLPHFCFVISPDFEDSFHLGCKIENVVIMNLPHSVFLQGKLRNLGQVMSHDIGLG